MRTVKTEFPDYDGELPYIAGYEDTSWHNDACPSIEKDYGNGVRVRIWCDYVDPERREFTHYNRFAIVVFSPTDEDGTDMMSTNDFHSVIERVAQFEASMNIPPLELAKAFCRQLHKQLDDGTMKIINRRNEEFEACGNHSTCATHDFCDANQVMLDAIESICGFADYHFAQNEMINAAWDIARKAKFDADKCVPVGLPQIGFTVNDAIEILVQARATLQTHGDSPLILSLTGSGLEDVEITGMVLMGDAGDSYVEVRAKHRSLSVE